MTQSTSTSATPRSASYVASGRRARSFRLSWRLIATWILLLFVAIGLRNANNWFGLHFTKGPVPLKRDLNLLSEESLWPEFKLHPRVPRVISEDELQTLGTHDYRTIRMVDRLKAPEDPTSVAEVFITYYTGKPDMVPHVPDECYLAGGFERVGLPYTQEFEVPGAGAEDDQLPVRIIQFRARRGQLGQLREDRDFAIFYFFRTNDQYATTRNEVRLALSNPFDKYAYYAKIEIRLMDSTLTRLASVEEGEQALPGVLSKLMPLLLRDHFTTLEEHAAALDPAAENF